MSFDLGLDPNGDLPQRLRLIDGDALTAQRVRRTLQTHVGEVLTDRTRGLDFIGWVQNRTPPAQIADRVRLELASVPGIVAVLSCVGSFNRETRSTTITSELQMLSGNVLQVSGIVTSAANSTAQWRVMMRGMGGLFPN